MRSRRTDMEPLFLLLSAVSSNDFREPIPRCGEMIRQAVAWELIKKNPSANSPPAWITDKGRMWLDAFEKARGFDLDSLIKSLSLEQISDRLDTWFEACDKDEDPAA